MCFSGVYKKSVRTVVDELLGYAYVGSGLCDDSKYKLKLHVWQGNRGSQKPRSSFSTSVVKLMSLTLSYPWEMLLSFNNWNRNSIQWMVVISKLLCSVHKLSIWQSCDVMFMHLHSNYILKVMSVWSWSRSSSRCNKLNDISYYAFVC